MCPCHDPSVCVPAGPDADRRAVLRMLAGAAAVPLLGGCERLPIHLVSDETVQQLGLETWQRIRSQTPPSRDPALQSTVHQVGRRLLTAAGEDPARWEMAVFASPQVNAFVLPGRKIGVLEGMLRATSSEDELAAVIGHEIGHLQAEHPQERLTAQAAKQWGLRLVSVALQLGDFAYANEIAALLGVGVEFGLLRPYSRRQELEADRLGLFTMAKAGFDPREAVDLWRRMDRMGGQRGPALLSTHPAPKERVEALEALIPEVTAASRSVERRP